MPKRVLVVEDDDDVRALYQRAFQAAGFETTEACDGEEAIQLLGEQAPDAMVLDISMPKVSGLQVIEHVREELGLKDLPIVVATAYPHLAEATLSAGATHTLLKPLALKKLVNLVRVLTVKSDVPPQTRKPGATKRL